MRLFAAVLASLSLIVLDQRHAFMTTVRSTLSTVVYPLQYLVGFPIDATRQLRNAIASYDALLQENRRLKSEQLVLKTRLLKFSALEKENIRLRALLETSFKLGEQVLVAELLSVNFDPFQHLVLVDKGSRFGLFGGQPVLDANGVVGQVVRVNFLNAEVLLITDPNHAIPVQITRNGLRTIAVGSGQINRIELPYLPNNADVVPGDLLLTSGLGGTFPQGYPVATVTAVIERPDRPFAEVWAEPVAKLDRIRELLVVWSNADPIPLTPDTSTLAEQGNAHEGR